MKDLVEKLQSFDAKKRQLFLLMLKQQGVDVSELILPQERSTREFPVSFTQQRMWFLDQVEEEKSAYNEAFAITVGGALDAGLLERSFRKLAERHESLRTTFGLKDEAVVQILGDEAVVDFTVADLSQLPEELQQTETEQLLREEGRRPFDLAVGPVWRAKLITKHKEEHILSFVLHHIICDATSNTLLVQELFTIYTALKEGREPELPENFVQFADYAAWQRTWLSGDNYKRQLAFWKQELEGAAPLLELPTDRPRPSLQTYRGASYTAQLPKELTSLLHQLCDREKSTMFTVLLSTFQVLLHRYSGQRDIVVGTSISNRNRAEVERVVGYFANTLVMRSQIGPEDRFLDVLHGVKEKTIAAHEHQEFPFEKLVEELNPERSLSYSPLFQVLFTYVTYRAEPLRLPELSIDLKKAETGLVKFDIMFNMSEGDNGLQLHLEYNTDLFDHSTIARFCGHFQTLLGHIARHPEHQIADLPLLSAEEADELAGWNETDGPVAADKCLHELIEAQAQNTPDAVAVAGAGQELSYRELDEQANRLAHHLQKRGVGPGVNVGIAAKRSTKLVVGMLAILKAGGAYLPLDPNYPKDRIAYIIEDSGLQAVVTERRSRSVLPAGIETICLDEDQAAVAGESRLRPLGTVSPDDNAYMIYTSGSTGKPKGVPVSHRSVVNYLAGLDQRVGAGADDTMLAVSSISFDISVTELFWPLANGAKVVVVPDQALGGAAAGKGMDFSLFYFASDEGAASGDKYDLLLEGAKFADQNGFSAVWTPERHFHQFGGLYPSPSVVSGALAVLTERIAIRAGSVVLPLHHPVRVAEEWSVVDNLSRGRVGLSLASGWHADDFVLAPDNFESRYEVLEQSLDTLKRLWRGEAVHMPNGAGVEIPVSTLPRPVQAELPVWITSSGSPKTFEKAGELGANVLTHLLGQTPDELREKIALYRAALERHGHDPAKGQVALMLHTFVSDDMDSVREKVRGPFLNYLQSSFGLIENLVKSTRPDLKLQDLTAEDLSDLLEFSFERYFETSGLFGTPDSCLQMVNRLKEMGVDEIACLIDFGVDHESVKQSLHQLNELRIRSQAAEDQPTLAELARDHRPTMMQSTPSLMRLLLADSEAAESLQPLHKLMLGGEALTAALAAEAKDKLDVRLFNLYGPTETTIFTTIHEITDPAAPITVGYPNLNTQLHILDDRLQQLPVGLQGQLYIGGAGVTRGYHNRPELTAERFIDHPLAGAGRKLYQSGDIARRLPDGTIEVLGRDDHQVKLRGYRIELGEIEAVLEQHPAVQEAAAAVKTDADGDQQLWLYYVTAAGETLSQEAVRESLKAKLPDYFLPNACVQVERMPLTPNGKIDRSALLQLGHTVQKKSAYAPPRTPIEETVCAIWEEVLGAEQVGIYDDFFELGGHSLLITKLLIKIRESFGLELPLRALFQARTVAALSEVIVDQQLGEADDDLLASLLAELEEMEM